MFEELTINISSVTNHHPDGDRRKKKVREYSPIGCIHLQYCNPSSLEKLIDILQEEVFAQEAIECRIQAKTDDCYY